MKKLGNIIEAIAVLIALMLLSSQAIASEIKDVKIFAENYNPVRREFNPIEWGYARIKSSPYNYIISSLKTQLASIGQNPTEANIIEQPDYRVVFIDIPITYQKEFSGEKRYPPDLNPSISKNKYEDDNSASPYRFTSPWLRGVIYIKDNKPVGGTIIVPISNFLRASELYYAAHNDWDKFSKVDPLNLDEVTMSYEDVYQPALKKYITMFLDNFSGRPTEEQIEKAFSSDGAQQLMLARLARMSPQSTVIPFDGTSKLVGCLNDSIPYYTSLYEYMFSKLLEKNITVVNSKTVNNIVPSAELLRSINSSSGNYNCFSNYLKETKR